ncbi:MAG: hypothetical protein GXY44_14585 [Phycisphaerales bacterium]|nr:hypothetical protein [Phycisphaerales bacterium]
MMPCAAERTKSRVPVPKTYLSPKELEEFKQELLDVRRKLLESGDADRTSKVDNLSNKRGVLSEIDQALQRIETGTYGMCLATHRAIPRTNLKGMPWAKYCYND